MSEFDGVVSVNMTPFFLEGCRGAYNGLASLCFWRI